MVRHGQYETAKRDEGRLTEIGHKQAQKTADALHNIPFSTIYHSTILRAKQTAEIIARKHEDAQVVPTDLLRECVPSIPSHMTGLFNSNHPGTSPKEMDFCVDQLQTMYATYFVPPKKDDVYELFVCHGNVIRYITAHALRADAGNIWLNMLIHNCGISHLMVDRQQQTYMITHNGIGHLPEELRTHN
jgi:broad specificity phosphatase PhoE